MKKFLASESLFCDVSVNAKNQSNFERGQITELYFEIWINFLCADITKEEILNKIFLWLLHNSYNLTISRNLIIYAKIEM